MLTQFLSAKGSARKTPIVADIFAQKPRAAAPGRPPRARGTVRLGVVVSYVLAFALLAGVVHFLLRVFEPRPAVQSPVPVYRYDMAKMQAALDWPRVKARQDQILAFGSRFLGQPGMYATEDYIRRAYRAAGLELYEQENWTVVPRTLYREIYAVSDDRETSKNTKAILGEAPKPPENLGRMSDLPENGGYGRRLDDVEIFPFMPNHLQPVTTPDEGIVGELVIVDEATLKSRRRFDDCIGLIDTTDGRVSTQYNFDWGRYAQMGMRALIVAHPQGLDHIPWKLAAPERGGMVASVPINFVRLAATEGIFAHAGERIRLRVRVRFEETRNTTLVGILRAGTSTHERPNQNALLLLTNYDAASILPDRAPGVAQAIPVATQLALLDGLAAYRESLVRDVVFVAFGAQVMARDGDNNLLKILDENVIKSSTNLFSRFFSADKPQTQRELDEIIRVRSRSRLQPWLERQSANNTLLQRVETILKLFSDAKFLADADFTDAAIAALDQGTQDFLREQTQYVMDSIVFDLSEPPLQAKLRFLQQPDQSIESEPFLEYQKAKKEYDRAVSLSGRSLGALLRSGEGGQAFLRAYDVRGRWKARFEELKAFHERRAVHLAQNIELIGVFNPYNQILVFDNKMVPATNDDNRRELMSFTDGAYGVNAQMREMSSLLSSARQRVAAHNPALADIAKHMEIPALTNWHFNDVGRMTRPMSNMSSVEWTCFGYHMYTMLSFGRTDSCAQINLPVDLPFMHDVQSLQYSMATFAEMLLSVAHGNGRFAPIQLGWLKKHFGGRVLASNIGQSMVPHFPVKGAVMSARSFYGKEYSYPGFYEHPLIMTDPYGNYELFNTPSDFWVNNYIWKYGYSPVAAAYGADGRITWMKDEGENGQRLYKSVNINWFDAKVENITLVLFRAAPVGLLDLTNPQKMSDFSGVRLFESRGLTEPAKRCQFRITPTEGMCVTFVEPEKAVYLALESGSPENDLAKEIRGFALGIPPEQRMAEFKTDPAREIDGPGYLAQATPVVQYLPLEMARSMAFLNGRRLDVQKQYNMADQQILDYDAKARALLESAEKPDNPRYFSTLDARDSVTYSMLNHPVLRRTIAEAVIGILYYLALLAPFVFFFEKMAFCYSDIRKQLAAQALIFLAVFALLRLLHPAFHMIRSSLMILLGFVVILIAGSMTLLFSGKFKQNLEEFRKRRGVVAGAQVNALAAMGSAFMLGLNNMHRRKMRTALTCGTLTLMTFAMICFTSIQSDLVNEQTAIGKAPYQGLLLKREQFRRFTNDEVFAFRAKYSHKFLVCPRKISLGIQNWINKQGNNPELEIVYNNGERSRHVRFQSYIQMTSADPLRSQIRMTTRTPWFSEAQERSTGGEPCPVILPAEMAESLGIKSRDVEAGGVNVQINGSTFAVLGIFDSQSLAELRDLDGQDILPYDIEAIPQVQTLESGEVAVDDNAPRIAPSKLVLFPYRDLGIQVPNEKPDPNASIALCMPKGDYRQVRAEIDACLEQSERPAFFGIDGVAYRGRRARVASLSGLADMLIPLLVAALTVLNTMKGSVFERRGEIAVYNAVGIAPRQVFWMFFAEATVYAVAGSLLGYLLSQAAGRVLAALDLAGGMKMTFTSLTTIYASLAIGATVFLSTWIPARTAMEIAQPAEEAGWRLPEPEGDTLAFDLPFTFNYRDRVAVLAFCRRFLEDHGEGGSGRFFAGPPELGVQPVGAQPEGPGDALIPILMTQIWLKPFDLGVSQMMTLQMPPDEATREFKARLELRRLSGTRDAWLRLNHAFVAEIRGQVLHWRAVAEPDRRQLFDEARALIPPPPGANTRQEKERKEEAPASAS